MDQYSNLLNEIKIFSKSKFDNVYSKAFLKHIILPSYNPQKKSFCVAYCDFNRLNDINTIYSEKIGDELLSNSYSKIHTILEQNFGKDDFSISLLGGDEFLILINSIDQEKVINCFETISSIFHSGSITNIEKIYDSKDIKNHIPKFVDFSYGITFSNEKKYESIYEMLYDAETRQSHSKIFLQSSETDFYTSLKAYANHCISNFFKNYRFNNYINFDISDDLKKKKRDIRNLLLLYVNSLVELINKPEEISLLISKLKTLDPILFEQTFSLFSEDECYRIYSCMQKENDNPNQFYTFKIDELHSLLNILIREAVSGCYNKIYFQNYFIKIFENSDFTFSTAILVDTTNMKISNLKLGHSATDQKIKLFSSSIQNNFEIITHLPFSENNFDISDNYNFIFDFGGGNYFILCKNFIDNKTISEILSKSIQGCEPLGFIYFSDNIMGIKNLNSIVNKLYINCLQKKHLSKHTSLSFSNDDLINTFKMFLAPTLEFYLNNNPSNPLDIKELKAFSNIIAYSIMEYAVKYRAFTNEDIDNSSKDHRN